jgi:hypothetical protein
LEASTSVSVNKPITLNYSEIPTNIYQLGYTTPNAVYTQPVTYPSVTMFQNGVDTFLSSSGLYIPSAGSWSLTLTHKVRIWAGANVSFFTWFGYLNKTVIIYGPSLCGTIPTTDYIGTCCAVVTFMGPTTIYPMVTLHSSTGGLFSGETQYFRCHATRVG